MAANEDLWTAVVAAYPADDLISLTNPGDPSATAIVTATGQGAAQAVIDLWPAYAQEDYDETDALHVEIGIEGTIAVLFRRGGVGKRIAEIEWGEVFSDEGMIARVRRKGARGRQGPSTNSGVSTHSEDRNGRAVQGWSDRGALPLGGDGLLPNQALSDGS